MVYIQRMNIDGTVVNRISGPVSMYYLRPDLSKWVKRGITPPEVLLFGDIHLSEEDLCEDCEEEKGCYRIDSHNFLGLFDRMGEKYPIDWFVESAPVFQSMELEGQGILFDRFYPLIRNCYSVESRVIPAYEKMCPTKYIRWHYADPRFFDKHLEGYVFAYIDEVANPENKKIRIGIDIRKVMASRRGFQVNDRHVEQSKVVVLEALTILFQTSSLPEYKDSESDIEIKKGVKDIIKSLGNVFLENFKYSKIGKQTRDIPIDWVNIFLLKKEVYHMIYRLREYGRELRSFYKLVSYDFQGVRKPTSDLLALIPDVKRYAACIHLVWEIFLHFNACLLDIYTVGRMLKKPFGGIPSYLSLVYAGEDHAMNICLFLITELGYEVVSEKEEEEESRCIEIKEPFAIDLEVYKQQRRDLVRRWNEKEMIEREYWKRVGMGVEKV